MAELFGWIAGYPDRYPKHYPDPYPDGYLYPYPDGYPATRVAGFAGLSPLRYVGVRLADSEPVDGPPSSAEGGAKL